MYVVWGKENEIMNEYALGVFLLGQTEMILLCRPKQNMNPVDFHGQAKFAVSFYKSCCYSAMPCVMCGCHLPVQLQIRNA
jgi:hypothetical protein